MLDQQLKKMNGRLSAMYQTINGSAPLSPELLPAALKELGIASEELQVAIEELTSRNEELFAAQHSKQQLQRRYHNLFDLAPDAYLLTTATGIIEEGNRAVANLFHIKQQFLVGKPLVSLVPMEERSRFRNELAQLVYRNRLNFSVNLQRRLGEPFTAMLTADIVRDEAGEPFVVRWLIRDITEQKRAEVAAQQADYDPFSDHHPLSYCKGENIPLDPRSVCLINQGLVKLSTLSDRGEEMLIGLANRKMAFGSSLTALPFYQAIALTDVQLISISLTEVAQSPRLAQVLLPLIIERVYQTESFLAVYGQLMVEDRLQRLLDLLKKEVGKPSDNGTGTHLGIRLTHQDIASACGTTRVTITRLLGKLQKQGKLTLDAKNHWTLHE